MIVTNADYRFLVGEQAEELGIPLAGVLLEPVARNTTAAIAAAAVFAERLAAIERRDPRPALRPRRHHRRQLLAVGRYRRHAPLPPAGS